MGDYSTEILPFWGRCELPICPLRAKINNMNWDLLGHEWAVDLLRENVARGQVRHAYLFTGSQGVGRRTMALRLAQAVNCLQPPEPGVPCRVCRICSQIERMQHPDLAIVQAETQGGTLKVEQIRELQHTLSLAPYDAPFRVAILLRFEEANPSAMNALLKTLEEPAAQVILVVTAESAERLLPTIVSRCEVLRLRPLPVDQVSEWLNAQYNVPVDQAQLLAHIAGGRPGYALRLRDEPESLEKRRVWLDDLARLLAASRVERFQYAETLSKDKDAFRLALLAWLTFWQDVLMQSAGSSQPLANLDRREEIQVLAARFDLPQVHHTVAVLERTLDLLDRNVNTRLAAEVLMLDLPRP
jgi:DNA polymerase-3 subunit delta'